MHDKKKTESFFVTYHCYRYHFQLYVVVETFRSLNYCVVKDYDLKLEKDIDVVRLSTALLLAVVEFRNNVLF